MTQINHFSRRIQVNIPWEKARRYFSRLRTGILKNLVFNNIRGLKNLIVILDHLGKVKSKFFMFLDSLRDHGKLILITRSAQKKEAGRLWMMLWGFEKIEVGPLALDETKRLASYCLGGMNRDTMENNKWFRETVRLSGGNPEVLRGLCDEIRKQNLNAKGEIHVRLANIDRKITSLLKEE